MSPCAAPVVCIGGLNIDRKLRLLAEALPASSNPCEAHETPGGVVRNVAENLARLGLPVALVAAVGDDAATSTTPNTSRPSSASRSSTRWTRPSPTSTATARITPTPS